jgi:hypothetical protein
LIPLLVTPALNPPSQAANQGRSGVSQEGIHAFDESQTILATKIFLK